MPTNFCVQIGVSHILLIAPDQVQHYKHERECNAVIAQTREDKISRLETLMDGILPTEEFMEEEFLALQNEHKVDLFSFYIFKSRCVVISYIEKLTYVKCKLSKLDWWGEGRECFTFSRLSSS